MADYAKYYEARDIITDILKKDLIGPVKEDEVLRELPTQYYIMGKLYPLNPRNAFDRPEDLARDPVLENPANSCDASISLSHQQNPSSLAITFTLKSGVNRIKASGKFAFYDLLSPKQVRELGIAAEAASTQKVTADEHYWKRQEIPFQVELNCRERSLTIPLGRKMELRFFGNACLSNGERIATVAMVNTNQVTVSNKNKSIEPPTIENGKLRWLRELADKSEKIKLEKAGLCAYQVSLTLSGLDGACVFTDSNRQIKVSSAPEFTEMEMLYRNKKHYAQGHGCSVEWDTKKEPASLSLAWLPQYDLRQMMAAKLSSGTALSMHYLAKAEPAEIIKMLTDFTHEYKQWINQLDAKLARLDKQFQKCGKYNIEKCRAACNRINDSVLLLKESLNSDGKAMRAFQLANEAMFLQRRQSLLKAGENCENDKITWHPFQLAFILHELSSFINPTGPEREIVDLLWFPTGGGKTEAYLGITAFVIFLRRLKDAAADGVTVIMRYTLRLLTLQQFERAGMLICACELLRRKYHHLGGAEISIGLWVGGELTPNKIEDAEKALSRQQKNQEPDEKSNPCQIKVCPWCGKDISVKYYEVKGNRMHIYCPNEACDFHDIAEGLPLHIIDTAIYKNLPTFIVATVDKFAQLPLQDKPAALFGISVGKRPPELIIQDELHLISGPLGTMTGIYEAAVTRLCRQPEGNSVKIIASTATIRNAGKQIKALYNKEFSQFPPQGLSASDSYFAVEASEKEKPTRRYLGVVGVGTTATTALIRVNAALLFASRYLEVLDFDDKVIDNYWTMTEYFNSLRELGGAGTHILDSVQSRFTYLAHTKFAEMGAKMAVQDDTKYDFAIELTSRLDNLRLTKIIQKDLKRSYAKGKHDGVYDFILATNMISVGVDVGRLGTMIMVDQPKSNAEYIQATSRVGRDNPGLVVTVYNGARSRDCSHYEQFMKYHSALYRYVEATSLTPFADRARDRGLQALYVALCRYLVSGLMRNTDAGNYDPDAAEVKHIRQEIIDYVRKVDPDEVIAVATELDDIEKRWQMETKKALIYKSYSKQEINNQLCKRDIDNDRFRMMNSMRNVDAQSGVYLLGK